MEEFPAGLGITPSTYYRALKGQVELSTMRRIASLVLVFHLPQSLNLLPQHLQGLCDN